MTNARKIKLFIIVCLVSVFVYMSFPQGVLAAPSDPISSARERLQGISSEEKQVLQNLFDIEHEIQSMEEEGKSLSKDMETLNGEVKGLDEKAKVEEKYFEKKREVLKQVLKVYQKQGPGSYLEILLDSENLNMFLWRLNTLQDLSRNTGDVLNSLEESSRKIAEKRQEITQKLAVMESKKLQLKESISKNLKLKEDKEKYLASLKEDRQHYQEQLANTELMWNDARTLFSQITGEFSSIVKDGSLPMDVMNLSFTFSGVEASIDEKTFNKIATGYPHLSDMNFSFYDGIVEIKIPEKNLVLTGKFQAMGDNMLRFVAEGGSFYGISLEKETIQELFKEGYLELDLKPLLGSNILDSVGTSKGQLKFIIKIVF